MGTMSVVISGTSVMVLESSFEIDESISATGTARFTVRDDTGSFHWTDGQPVTITDSVTGLAYSGFVATSIEDRQSPNPLLFSQVTSIDNSYLSGKRTYQGPEYTNAYAGAIVADLLNVLAVEGVTAQYASQRDSTQADFSSGTLTNVVAANNVGDGDLELALAGTVVTILEDTTAEFSTGSLYNVVAANNTLTPVSTPAVKIAGTCSQPGSSNAYSYVKIWNGSQLVGSSDFLNYDIWIDPASPSGQIGVDVVFSDGTTWRDTAIYADEQAVYPHPNNDLTGLATGQWYHRSFWMVQYSGKTISFVTVVLEGDKIGAYTGYMKNIYLQSTANHYFFQNTLQMAAPQQLGNNGYDTTVVTVVPTYDLLAGCERVSTAYSISAVGLLQSSDVTWSAVVPAGTLFIFKYSIDGGNSYYPCAINSPLPTVPAGSNIAGTSIMLLEEFAVDPSANTPASPEVAPVLSLMEVTLSPSYHATKADVTYNVDTSAAWAAGTFTNTTNNGGANLTLNGSVRNWDNGDSSSQPLYTNNAQQGVNNRRFELNIPAAGEARSRLDFAGQIADGTMECDVLIDTALIKYSLVYRTTGWQNNDGTWAYACEVTTTGIALYRGTNTSSGSGAVTTIVAPVAIAITSGNWHRLKVVFAGSSHQVFLDDVMYINATDATYTAAGYCAIRHSSIPGGPAYHSVFDNFGIASALTGQWVSPATSIAGAATYQTSVIAWADISTDPGNTDTLLVETQVDGATWQTATNGSPVPNLTVGQNLTGLSLKLRVTLTTSTASTLPGIDRLCTRIVGAMTATGNRLSPALSLAPVGRLGSSLVAWDDNLPGLGTSLQMETSVDGGVSWQVATNGGPIANLTPTPAPWQDFFATNTSADYTQTFFAGGGAATWTWSAGSLAATQTTGVDGILEYTGLSAADMAVWGDFNRSDSGGLVARMVDTNHAYFVSIADASAATFPNTMKLHAFVSGLKSLLGTVTITFVRGSYHRFVLDCQGSTISVWMDGVQLLSVTDTRVTAAGTAALFAGMNNGNQIVCTGLQIAPYGQLTAGVSVLLKTILTSTDPLNTPQVLSLTLTAFGNTISPGAFIPQTSISGTYIIDALNTLAKASNYWQFIDKNRVLWFQATTGVPSPWVASDTPGDFLDAGLTVEDASTLYRNRQIVKNVLATVGQTLSKRGDTISTSWTAGYAWASQPMITVNGVPATVGIKGVDTGRQFYWALGDPTITEDASGPTYDATFLLSFIGLGQYLTNSQADNVPAQTTRAAIDHTSGIVENTVDGTGLTKPQGDAMAAALLLQYCLVGRLIKATTRRSGLAIGQLLPVFLAGHGIANGLYLVRAIKTTLTTEFPNGTGGGAVQQGWYAIEAISGADIGDWTRLYQQQATVA